MNMGCKMGLFFTPLLANQNTGEHFFQRKRKKVEPSKRDGSNQNAGLASIFLGFAWINICKQWEQML